MVRHAHVVNKRRLVFIEEGYFKGHNGPVK